MFAKKHGDLSSLGAQPPKILGQLDSKAREWTVAFSIHLTRFPAMKDVVWDKRAASQEGINVETVSRRSEIATHGRYCMVFEANTRPERRGAEGLRVQPGRAIPRALGRSLWLRKIFWMLPDIVCQK